MKTVAVVILNYNNFEDTINCIESVENHNTASIKYIVVDNGSTRTKTIETLKEYINNRFIDDNVILDERTLKPSILPKATLFLNTLNEGYAKGNNRGLKLAEKDDTVSHIMILNNDVLFVEDIIPELSAIMEKLTDCAIISPVLYTKNMLSLDYTCARMAPSAWSLIIECLMLGLNINSYRNVIKKKYWLFWKKSELMYNSLLEIEMPSGSCMLIKKDLFRDIGYFDPNTFLYYEENILFSKISSLGLKIYLIPKLRCIHLGASSTKNVASHFILRCGLESRTYYLNTYCNLSMAQKVVYAVAKTLYSFRLLILKFVKHK